MTEVRTTSSTGGQKGTKLARFDLVPVGPLTMLAEHYGVGASKYADNQWRQGYEWSKTYAALMRHLTAWWNGFDYDACSNDPKGCQHVDTEGRPFVAIREDACFNHTGSHHLAAVAWHAFAGLEFVERFPEHDDRYVAEPVEPEYAVGPLNPDTGTTSDVPSGIGVFEEEVQVTAPRWIPDYGDFGPDLPRKRRVIEAALAVPHFEVHIDGTVTQNVLHDAVQRSFDRR